jgi:sulfotransferase
MVKTYHFMAGLPRAGGTLLKSLLDQNPNIHANPVSPVMELMYYNEEYFKTSEQYNAYPKPDNAFRIVSSLIDHYYEERPEPIIIDHCRAWPNNIERIKTFITPNPKIICSVRDVAEILTSFITMIHRNSDQESFIDRELRKGGFTVDDDNRCQFLMGPDGIVDQALWALAQAFVHHNTHHLLLVEYSDLVNTPDETMRRIYDFLELDYYQHDYGNIHNNHRENEDQWNLKDMHYVRPQLKRTSPRPQDVLSQRVLNKYNKLEYWKYSDSPYLRNGSN